MTNRVYITGGSSGIGLGLAHFCAKRGGDIVLLARDQLAACLFFHSLGDMPWCWRKALENTLSSE